MANFMATTRFRTRTTQQQQPPPPSSRQWFRLAASSRGNSTTATFPVNASSRPPTPQDQKPPGHATPPGIPTESGRSTPPVTSPIVSKPKISLVTLSPPTATTNSSPSPSPSPSPSLPSPSLSRATSVKGSSPPLTPVPKPTSESRVTQQPLPSPNPNKVKNEPQPPGSSPSKVVPPMKQKFLSSPTNTPPMQQPILLDKSQTNHKNITNNTAAVALVDEEKTKLISFAGKNRGAIFVDVAASPYKQKSFKNVSEHPASPGAMGAFANSNVQGINNSLLFNSSFHHHDPGVHIIDYDTIAPTVTSPVKR